MMMVKIKITALAYAAVLMVGASVGMAAQPVIKDFSSTGGNPQNKTGPKDTMYLVRPGDKITFGVKAEGAEKYEWQVNKESQKDATSDSFAWTVPDKKGIWEIHLAAVGGDKEARQEWVVSTLSKEESPDFFDYFTDGKWQNRTETDPWGRKLPEWKKNDDRPGQVVADASRCVIRLDGDLYNSARLYAPHNITRGTWKCRIRVTPSMGSPLTREKGRVTVGFHPLTVGVRSAAGGYLGIAIASEFQSHLWSSAKLPAPNGAVYGITACNLPLVGAWGTGHPGILAEDSWKDLKVIRTPDGYARFWRSIGRNVPYLSNDYSINDFIDTNSLQPGDPDPLSGAQNVGVIGRSDGGAENKHWGEIDCIEIYKDKFISPKKVVYGEYSNSYIEGPGGRYYEVKNRKGIVLDGLDVRLADIAHAVGNQSLFRYDPGAKTADCYTDLCIEAGAELVLDGETLRMHCAADGEHQIRVRNSATVMLKDSTVTSADSHWYQWTFPSEFTPSGGYAGEYTGRFIARNSTIANCGGLYFSGPTELVLENTKLANLVEAPYPPPPHTGVVFRNWTQDAGPKHSLSFRGRQVCSRLLIKGCRISGQGDTVMRFLGMDPVVENTTIYDTELENVAVLVKKAYLFYWGYQHPTTLSLVNVKFAKLICETDGASVRVKYYLDVKAVDKNGAPLPGAKVSALNEIDPRHEPVNIREGWKWAEEQGYAKGGGKTVGLDLVGRRMPVYGYPLPSTTTGKDGHTPLPQDADHTMVLTDFVQDKDGRKEFTYTITVEKDGMKKVITGVNPGPEWYRADPDKPAYTITAVLDEK